MKTLKITGFALRRLSITILGLSIYGIALADYPGELNAYEAACLKVYKEQTAASVVEDWPSAEKFAENYLRDCKGAFGGDGFLNVLSSYNSVATANLYLGNPKKSITTADTCIATSYGYADCYLTKARGLLALSRLPEAKIVLDRTDRLLVYQLEGFKRSLRDARNTTARELAEAQIDGVESSQKLSASLKSNYFLK